MELDLEEVARPIPMPMPYSKPLHPSQRINQHQHQQKQHPPPYSNKPNIKPSQSIKPHHISVKPTVNQQQKSHQSVSFSGSSCQTESVSKGDRYV